MTAGLWFAHSFAFRKSSAGSSRQLASIHRRVSYARRAAHRVAPSIRYIDVTHPQDVTLASLSPATRKQIQDAEKYILGVYARPPFVLERGKGSWVWDTDGKKYLDFTAGIAVNALGHADPAFVERMAEAASTLSHTSNAYHHIWGARLAELLVTLTQKQGGLGYAAGENGSNTSGAKVFFSNSGTEANEGALKIARKVGKDHWAASSAAAGRSSADCSKVEIVCFHGSFHGRSFGALSVTSNPKYQQPFTPLLPGVQVGRLNVLEDVEQLVAPETCAVIVEPIQGEGGINVADVDWLRALRRRCDDVGAVLIFDEIQCGLYRTGTLWAHSTYPVDCHPDIITLAKPLANGYPIGAVVMRDTIAKTMSVGTHGTTFGGSPLACALGHHVLSRVCTGEFVLQVKETSEYIRKRLDEVAVSFPQLVRPGEAGVRGRGLILGLGFADPSVPGEVVKLARERGVLLLTAGTDALRLIPSLNVGREEVDYAMDVLESCLGLVANRT